MTKKRGLRKLPLQIVLRPIDVMDATATRAALNASKANICWWRKHEDMPPVAYRLGNDSFIKTSDLAAWLSSRGCTVKYV
jgi:hypothetical protein